MNLNLSRPALILSVVVLIGSCARDDVPPTSTAWPVVDGGIGTDKCTEGSDPSRCVATQCILLVQYEEFNQIDLVSRCRSSLFFIIPPELLWENDEGPFDVGGVRANLMGGYWWMTRNGARMASTTQTTRLMGELKPNGDLEPEIYEVKPGEYLRIHLPASSPAAHVEGCRSGVVYPCLFHDCSNQGMGEQGFILNQFMPEDEFAFSLILPLPFETREEALNASFPECGRYCDHPDSVPCSNKPNFLYLENVVTMDGDRFLTTCPDFSEGFNTIK